MDEDSKAETCDREGTLQIDDFGPGKVLCVAGLLLIINLYIKSRSINKLHPAVNAAPW